MTLLQRRLFKGGLVITGVAILFTAFMGFAHTHAGRPVLAAMGRMMGKQEFCPLGYDRLTTLEDRARSREARAEKAKDRPAARARVGLDFELGKMTRSEVEEWVRAHDGSCKQLMSSFEIECTGKFFGANESTRWLEFNADNILMSSKGVEVYRELAAAWTSFAQEQKSLLQDAPGNIKLEGPKESSAMDGLLTQSIASADLRNFRGSVRISNMGETFAVTHDYEIY